MAARVSQPSDVGLVGSHEVPGCDYLALMQPHLRNFQVLGGIEGRFLNFCGTLLVTARNAIVAHRNA